MEILDRKITYECPILRIEEREVRVAGGKVQTRWVVQRLPSVRVVGLTKEGRLTLIKERLESAEELAIQLPGGKLESFETDPEKMKPQALRELEEEAGYKASSIEFLFRQSVTTNWYEREFYFFAAWDMVFVGPHPEPGEQLIPFLVETKEIAKLANEHTLPQRVVPALNRAVKLYAEKRLL